MAKLRVRHRDPANKNIGIQYVHAPKASQLMKHRKIISILLGISVLLNIYLLFK